MANTNYRNFISSAAGLEDIIKAAVLETHAPEIRFVRKFGKTASLTANTEEDVWEYGGTKTFLTTASTLSIVSSSSADTLAGTGGRYLLIDGLDASYEPIQEVIVLNGLTPVISTSSYLRVQQSRIVYAGSGKKNAGNITISATSNSSVQDHMSASRSLSRATHFTIPNGYNGFITSITMSAYRATGGTGTTRGAEIDVHVQVAGVDYASTQYGFNNTGTGIIQLKPVAPSYLPPTADIMFAATTDTTGTVVSTQYEVLLIKGEFNQYTGL